MSDDKAPRSPGDVVEVRTLWSIDYRKDDSHPWNELGTHKEAAADILRTYDFWQEHHADFQTRLMLTKVTIKVADPELLRISLAQKEAPDAGPDLQCG